MGDQGAMSLTFLVVCRGIRTLRRIIKERCICAQVGAFATFMVN
jgi:hypothetical protein